MPMSDSPRPPEPAEPKCEKCKRGEPVVMVAGKPGHECQHVDTAEGMSLDWHACWPAPTPEPVPIREEARGLTSSTGPMLR
jgi:hypothetical protein